MSAKKGEETVKDAAGAEYGAPQMHCEATRLMLAVKRGDDGAFDELVGRLRGRAFSVARSMVGSRDDALELSQETFLKIYRSKETFRDGEPFLPWFHRILRNTCFSFLRQKRHVRSASAHGASGEGDEPDLEFVDDGPSPTEAALQNERARAFWLAFEKLSARDREILALRHFQELAYKEIAEALSIPEGTVMSRLFHARRRLCGVLDRGVFPEIDAGGDA